MAIDKLGFNPQITIKDSANNPDMGSIIELAFLKVLSNNGFYDYIYKRLAEITDITNVGGFSTAIVRLAMREVVGHQYDPINGAPLDYGRAEFLSLQINKPLTKKIGLEKYDLKRYKDGNYNVRLAIVNKWIQSAIESKFINFSAILLEAIAAHCILRYANGDKSAVFVKPKDKLKTKEQVEAFYFDEFRPQINQLLTKADELSLGTSLSDYNAFMSYDLYTNLSRVFANFLDIGPKVLTDATMYKDRIMGVDFLQTPLLNQDFIKDKPSRLNKDTDYLLKGIHYIMAHREMFAMPINFDIIGTTENPFNIGSTMFQIYAQYANPTALLKDKAFIVMDREPSAEDIKRAKALCEPVNGIQLQANNYKGEKRLQIQVNDPLYKFIFDKNEGQPNPGKRENLNNACQIKGLGEIIDNKDSTILAKVKEVNKLKSVEGFKVDNKTEGKATIDSYNSQYYEGMIEVTFNIKKPN